MASLRVSKGLKYRREERTLIQKITPEIWWSTAILFIHGIIFSYRQGTIGGVKSNPSLYLWEGLKKTIFFVDLSQICSPTHPRVFVWFESARLSAGGGCNCYLGNAHIEVATNWKVLPLRVHGLCGSLVRRSNWSSLLLSFWYLCPQHTLIYITWMMFMMIFVILSFLEEYMRMHLCKFQYWNWILEEYLCKFQYSFP